MISAVTKSGGNAFHGDLHYYFSGNSISAAPALRLNADPVAEKLVKHIQDTKQPDNQHEVGGSLGGYFIKDKLYFFSAFSPRFRSQSGTYKLNNGTETYEANRDSTFHQMFNKLSWDPASKIRTNFSWLWSPTKVNGYVPKPISFAPDTTSLPLSAVSLIKPSAAEELRQHTPRRQHYDIVTRTFVQTDVSKFGQFLGQHNIKGGWGFSKTVNRMNDHEMGGGYLEVFWNSQLRSTDATSRGTYGYYAFNDRRTAGVTGAGMHNLHLQDQWRVISRLTLTLGLRLENEKVPTFRRDIKEYGFQFGFADKIAPRVGASYDLFGDGRVKIYGSWGRYFDWVKYELQYAGSGTPLGLRLPGDDQ